MKKIAIAVVVSFLIVAAFLCGATIMMTGDGVDDSSGGSVVAPSPTRTKRPTSVPVSASIDEVTVEEAAFTEITDPFSMDADDVAAYLNDMGYNFNFESDGECGFAHYDDTGILLRIDPVGCSRGGRVEAIGSVTDLGEDADWGGQGTVMGTFTCAVGLCDVSVGQWIVDYSEEIIMSGDDGYLDFVDGYWVYAMADVYEELMAVVIYE